MAGLDKFKSQLLGEDGSAEERPPPPPSKRPVLYSLRLTFRGIQITATTPTNYAVRLETGLTELQLSNRSGYHAVVAFITYLLRSFYFVC